MTIRAPIDELGARRARNKASQWMNGDLAEVVAAARTELYRRSFLEFVRVAWSLVEPARPFVETIASMAVIAHLQAVADGKIRRLLIAMPPGLGKSTMCAVLYPAWRLARNASYRIICGSHAHSLAVRDSLRTRRVVESDWYRGTFGLELRSDENRSDHFATTADGRRIAVGVNGALVGFRANEALVDDSLNGVDARSKLARDAVNAWFTESMSTRLDNPDMAAMIVIQQRLHSEDLIGHLKGKPGWECLELPSEFDIGRRTVTSIWTDPRMEQGELLAPAIHSRAFLDEQRTAMGSSVYGCQYLQTPTDYQGGMFRRDQFQVCGPVDVPAGGRVVRGWDLAASTGNASAYTVGVKIRLVAGRLYVEDVRRIRGSAHQVERLIVECAEGDGVDCIQDIPQDPGQAGKAQKSYLGQALHGHRCQFSPETGDKAERAAPFAAQVEAGNVALVKAQWNAEYVNEAESFPLGAFKDQMDATSRAYSALLRRPVASAIAGAPDIISIAGGR